MTVSVLTLTFISIDRWYAICFPLRYVSTNQRAIGSIAFIWMVALLSGDDNHNLYLPLSIFLCLPLSLSLSLSYFCFYSRFLSVPGDVKRREIHNTNNRIFRDTFMLGTPIRSLQASVQFTVFLFIIFFVFSIA